MPLRSREAGQLVRRAVVARYVIQSGNQATVSESFDGKFRDW